MGKCSGCFIMWSYMYQSFSVHSNGFELYLPVPCLWACVLTRMVEMLKCRRNSTVVSCQGHVSHFVPCLPSLADLSGHCDNCVRRPCLAGHGILICLRRQKTTTQDIAGESAYVTSTSCLSGSDRWYIPELIKAKTAKTSNIVHYPCRACLSRQGYRSKQPILDNHASISK